MTIFRIPKTSCALREFGPVAGEITKEHASVAPGADEPKPKLQGLGISVVLGKERTSVCCPPSGWGCLIVQVSQLAVLEES